MLFKAIIILAFFASFAQAQHLNPCEISANNCDNATTFLICKPQYRPDQNATCICTEDRVWESTTCKVKPGLACSVDEDCVQSATCGTASRTCDCIGNYAPSSARDRCRGMFNTTCTGIGVDVCNSEVGLACRAQLPPPNRCLCSTTSTWSDIRSKCVAQAGSDCNSTVTGSGDDDDCTENSYCNPVSKTCTCLKDYSKEDTECSLIIGSSCASPGGDLRCNELEYLTCDGASKNCTCRNDLVQEDDVCKAKIGGECDPMKCAGDAVCHNLNKKCFCEESNNMFEFPGTKKCVPITRKYADYCRGNGDCESLEYLSCNLATHMCECATDMTYENGRCVHALEKACTPNRNCIQNSFCINDVCECNSLVSKKTSDGKCRLNSGESCSTTNPCNNEEGLECGPGGNCICPGAQDWDPIRSHCLAPVSGNCTTASDYCTANAKCSSRGICECNNNYSQNLAARQCHLSYGQTCGDQVDTHCNIEQFLTCIGNICSCPFKYQTWDKDLGTCVSLHGGYCGAVLTESPVKQNMTCIESTKCTMITNRESKCLCEENLVEDTDGRCVHEEETTTEPAPNGVGHASISFSLLSITSFLAAKIFAM